MPCSSSVGRSLRSTWGTRKYPLRSVCPESSVTIDMEEDMYGTPQAVTGPATHCLTETTNGVRE